MEIELDLELPTYNADPARMNRFWHGDSVPL